MNQDSRLDSAPSFAYENNSDIKNSSAFIYPNVNQQQRQTVTKLNSFGDDLSQQQQFTHQNQQQQINQQQKLLSSVQPPQQSIFQQQSSISNQRDPSLSLIVGKLGGNQQFPEAQFMNQSDFLKQNQDQYQQLQQFGLQSQQYGLDNNQGRQQYTFQEQQRQPQQDKDKQKVSMNQIVQVYSQASEQQKIIQNKLKILQGRIFRVHKLAESSIGYNPRMLGIRGNGMIVYYSQVIDEVKTNRIERITIPPKAGVMIEGVKSVNTQLVRDKTELIIVFPKRELVTFKNNQNGSKQYPTSNKDVSWTFLFDDPIFLDEEDKKKRPKNDKKLVQQMQNDQKHQEELLEQMMNEHEKKEQQEKLKKLQEMEGDRRQEEEERKKKEEEDEKQKQLEEQRRRDEQALFDQNKEKREKEEKIKNEKRNNIQNAWEYRLYLLLEDLAHFGKESFDETLRNGLKLFHLVGEFRSKCVQTVIDLIDSFCLPETAKNKPIQIDTKNIRYNLKEADEMIYFENKVIVRIAQTEMIQNVYDTRRVQLLNHEFRAYEILADILLLLKKSNFCPIKVPLSCQVEYRGFKCICIADLPITDQCLVMGATQNGTYLTHTPIVEDLKQINDIMNLKPFKLPLGRGQAEVYLSVFAEVYRAKPELWDDVRKLIDENSDIWEELHTVLKKRKDHMKIRDEELEQEIQQRFKDQYYLIKVGGLFPVQVDASKSYNYYSNRLRPELVTEHCPEKLSPGSFLTPINSEDQEKDDINTMKASSMLRNEVIPKLVQLLDKLTIVPVDSPTLSSIFHQNGVNMRFLGKLANTCLLPHLKEIAIVEMVARTSKKVLNNHWVEFSKREFREEQADFLRRYSEAQQNENQFSRMSDQSQEHAQLEFKQLLISAQGELVIDFLNLLFGNGNDTIVFWEQILRNQIKIHYEYDIGTFPPQVTPGGLLHSILYHCRLKINYSNQILFFKTSEPFQFSDFIGLSPLTKCYSYRSTEIRKLGDKYKEYRTNLKTLDLALKSLNLLVAIEKGLRNENNLPHAPLPEAILFADMGEIHLQQAEILGGSNLELEQAIAKAKIALDLIPPYHAEAVKPLGVLIKAYYKKGPQEKALECFDEAIKILEFHVGPYHPLHASLYSIMSQCYLTKKRYQDSLILLKSALICCTRILGNNHLMTAEVYMDMAHVYMKMSNLTETVKVLEKALVINETEKGQMSADCGKLNLQISGLYQQMGKFDNAYQFAQVALSIFEPHDASFSQEMLESTYMCAICCDQLQNNQLSVTYSEKLYEIVEKNNMKKFVYYEFCIKQTMLHQISLQSQEIKNFMFKLLIAFSSHPDELQKEEIQSTSQKTPNLLKVSGLATMTQQRFKPPIENEEKIILLDNIILQIRESKNLSDFFISMFYCFKGKFHVIQFDKKIYSNFQQTLKKIEDKRFVQFIEVYQSLIEIYGEELFYNHLKKSYPNK